MIELTNADAQVCVVGRTQFYSGIGAVTYAACELLSRSYPVSIYPTSSADRAKTSITLPNGRAIPVCRDLNAARVFFYTDVLWNGAYDYNYTLAPGHGLRIAHSSYDSDELPDRWVQILNRHFDAVVFPTEHQVAVAEHSGVSIPVGVLPIGLDLEKLLVRAHKPSPSKKLRFGSLAGFHRRKGLEQLVTAFIDEFGQDRGVELLVHSNLVIDDTLDRLRALIARANCKNIKLSTENLDDEAKTALLDSFDVLISCSRGEGYSIGPREALALGKVLAVSDIGAHQDLLGVEGVFAIQASNPVPARYPEINNQIFGNQFEVDVVGVRQALRDSRYYLTEANSAAAVAARRSRAAEFSFSGLATSYAELIDPLLRRFKTVARESQFTRLPRAIRDVALSSTGRHTAELDATNRTIVPCHDGGFFSVFNAFMTHLVWDMREERCHLVLPDWDVARLLQRRDGEPLTSFCYGQPSDGNLWLSFFDPLFGLSHEDMNSAQFLYHNAALPRAAFNEVREPTLTHVNAYELYRSPGFDGFRRQYARVYRDHVRPLPGLAAEVESFAADWQDSFCVAAHVKHPSHVIEQPGGSIARTRNYMDAIRQQVADRGIPLASRSWSVFLATDQDSVVMAFEREFGERLHVFRDVRRTSVAEDREYELLTDEHKGREGFMIQHRVAADATSWNTRMGTEVLRDAMAMARCDVLLHVVSNISTAVSYLNPDVRLVFCD